MPLPASPPIPVGESSPLVFPSPGRGTISLMLSFYSDAAGTLLISPGTGSRVIAVKRIDSIRLDDADKSVTVPGVIPRNLFELVDGSWQPVAIGDGQAQLELTALDGETPAGAVCFRYTFSVGEISGRLTGATLVEQTRDLSIDLLKGQGSHPVFSARINVPNNTTADVWPGAALVRPLPLGPKPMFLVSSSAADTFGNASGAQLVVVSFIDENGDWRNTDLLPMTGLAQSPITYKPTDGILGNADKMPAQPSPPGAGSILAQIFRVMDATVIIAAGATEALPQATNIGDIRVRDGGGVVFEVIPAGTGRSQSGAFHCPRGYTARVTYASVGTARGQGTATVAITYGVGTAWTILPIAAVSSTTAPFDSDSAVTLVSERADIQAKITTASNAIDVSFILQFRLVPIESVKP